MNSILPKKSLYKYITLCILVLGIGACGFQLRGSQALPTSLTQVLINAPLQYSPLSRALQKRLPVYQLTGIINSVKATTSQANAISNQDALQKTVVIQLNPEQFERRLLSVFTTGQVAEYELLYTVEYSVVFPGADAISNSLTVSREYQDDPDQILAKSRELNLVLAELRNESADRIIRLLSSQYQLAQAQTASNSNASASN